MIDTLTSAWWTLRIGLGLAALLMGLDKFFDILADWGTFLAPGVGRLLPVSGDAFVRGVGVIEVIVGLAILAGFTRIGGYVLTTWLVAIAMSLATTGRFFDVALSAMAMALAAFALARVPRMRRAGDEFEDFEASRERAERRARLALDAIASAEGRT